MTISEHLTTFAGLPVRDYDPDAKRKRSAKPCAWRLNAHGEIDERPEHPFPQLLDQFVSELGDEATALVVGPWQYEDMCNLNQRGSSEVVQPLVAAAKRLRALRHLFLGDIVYTECEISWLTHGDLSALLPAFPKLEEFRIRGTGGLTFGKIRHRKLKSLAIESGGLPAALIEEVLTAELPALEHLELWLGDSYYGGITDPAVLQPLLAGKRFRKLRYLGLRNCKIADAVARAVADAPLLERLEVLDLSLGSLSDAGAEALLGSPAVRKLTRLDLHHHYVTDLFQAELTKLPIKVDLSEAQVPYFYTYDDRTYVDRYIVAAE